MATGSPETITFNMEHFSTNQIQAQESITMKQKQPRLGTNNEECTQDHNKPSNFKIHHFTYNSAYRSNQTEKKEKKSKENIPPAIRDYEISKNFSLPHKKLRSRNGTNKVRASKSS